jgi:hypothetical protein
MKDDGVHSASATLPALGSGRVMRLSLSTGICIRTAKRCGRFESHADSQPGSRDGSEEGVGDVGLQRRWPHQTRD